MIEGLQPYPEYRESSLTWIGKIPRHWDVRRTKLLLREVDSRTKTGKEQLLRVSQYTGVTERKAADGSEAPDTRASSLVGYKRVSPHDLVINIMLAWNGSMGVSRFSGIASPAYCVYCFREGALPWYFHNLFRTPLYKGRIKAASTGVVESRLRLYSDDLGRIEALVPPPDEQSAIVRFLEHANRKIDGFIRAKRKLIGLLNEQKQAIIHRAVTRGLDPNIAIKPSGISWLGDIPGHWDALPLKRLIRPGTTISYGIVQPGENIERGIPFLQTTNISKPSLGGQTLQRTTKKIAAAYPRTCLKAGDVVLGIRASVGAAHVIPAELAGVNLSRGIARIVPNRQILPDYLVAFLRSPVAERYWRYAGQGTTFSEISISSLRIITIRSRREGINETRWTAIGFLQNPV